MGMWRRVRINQMPTQTNDVVTIWVSALQFLANNMIPTKDFEVGHNTTPTPLSSTNSDLYDFSPSSNGNQSALQHNYESDTEDSNHNSESPVCDGQFEEYEKNGWPPGWNHTAIGVSSPCALSLSDRSTPLTEAATFRNRGGKGQGLMVSY